MRKLLTLTPFLALILILANIAVLSAQDDDSLLCTEDGITCDTPEDNACYSGGSMAWENPTEGPCATESQAWVCGWYVARYEGGYLNSLPSMCDWVELNQLVCLDPNPGTNWKDCVQGNIYYGDNPATGPGWDYIGPIIAPGETCPPGINFDRQVSNVQSDFSDFLISQGFQPTDIVCFGIQ